MKDCIFCKIVAGESLVYKVWEDKEYLAFLSLFPNTDGVTIVIPKKHYSSYAFDVEDKILSELTLVAKKVGKLLDKKLNVGRTALVFEGFGINHLHAKLFPMHGTGNLKKWKPIESKVDKFFKKYEGYISSHSYKREDDKKLEKIATRIRE